MEIDGNPLNEEELDIHVAAMSKVIDIFVEAADKMNVDRDAYITAAAQQLVGMMEVVTFKNYKEDDLA